MLCISIKCWLGASNFLSHIGNEISIILADSMLPNVLFATTTNEKLSVSISWVSWRPIIHSQQQPGGQCTPWSPAQAGDNTLCLLLERITHKESHDLAEEGVMDIQAAWQKVWMLFLFLDNLACGLSNVSKALDGHHVPGCQFCVSLSGNQPKLYCWWQDEFLGPCKMYTGKSTIGLKRYSTVKMKNTRGSPRGLELTTAC